MSLIQENIERLATISTRSSVEVPPAEILNLCQEIEKVYHQLQDANLNMLEFIPADPAYDFLRTELHELMKKSPQ